MSEHLGEEFINVRPDARGFRAELQAQVSGALSGVQSQVSAAQRNIGKATTVTPAGIVLPAGVRSVERATKELGATTQATVKQVKSLASVNVQSQASSHSLSRSFREAERDAGRYTRGMVAATAASTGFFRAVSFASGAFLIGAAAGATIGAAIKEFSDAVRVQAQTNALIKATGGAANVTAGQVDALGLSVLNLTGIDDELIKSSANIILTFRAIRNEVGEGNNIFDRAVKSVADISSVFKTDLRSSAVQVGKALQDPIRGVTALRRSGISLSVGQRDLIKRLVQTGNVLAAQKVILGEVDRQVGKTAESIGKTLPGRLAILRERSRNALGEYVRRVSESKEATELATSAGEALSEVFGVLKGIIAALGPSFLLFARATFAVTKAIGGGGTILAAVVAYKAIRVAIESAAVAQAFFTKQTLLGIKAITAEEAALLSSAGAFRGRSAAELLGTTAAVRGRKIDIGKAESKVLIPAGVRSVGKETAELGAVSGLAAARLGLFQTALTALKGPLGVGIAIAGVTAVLIKLSQTAEGMPGSLKAVAGALRPLSDAIRESQQAQTAVAGRREDVSIARFNQAAAVRGVQQAQEALNRAHAAEGSPLRVHLINQERAANQRLRDSLEELTTAQGALDDELARQDRDRKARASATANAQRALAEQIQFALRPPALGRGALAGAAQTDPQRAAKGFANLLRLTDDLSTSGDRLNKTVGDALRAILTTLDKIPTDKQVRLVVSLAAKGASTDAILRALGVLSVGTAAETEGRRLAPPPGIAGQEALFQTLKAQEALERKRFQTLRDIAAERRGELATAREQVSASRDARDAARESLQSSIRGLTDARRALADSQRTLTDTIREANQAVADAIRQGRESVNQSVRDAKSNLDDLGQAVADALGKFSEAGAGATKGLGARLRALRAEILKSGGGFQTERAAQEIAFRVQQQPKAEVDTEKIKQNFADLTDAVNRGTISLPTFKKRLQDLLKGFSLTDFRKQTGPAAANLLREQIGALRKQAGINLTGPRRPGGGTQTDIVRPLVAVAEASKAIATARVQAARDIAGAKRDLGDAIRSVTDAEKQITRSQRDLRDAERELIRAQAKETRLNTAATRANTRAHTQLVEFLRAQERLSPKVKPPQGEKGKTTTGLVSHGARNP